MGHLAAAVEESAGGRARVAARPGQPAPRVAICPARIGTGHDPNGARHGHRRSRTCLCRVGEGAVRAWRALADTGAAGEVAVIVPVKVRGEPVRDAR